MMNVREEDRQYRRGMVLGLTMAEIMLLLIFLLLLILAARFVDEKALAQDKEDDLKEAEKRIGDLEEIVQSLTGGKIDITKEYQKIKDENERLKKENDQVRPVLLALEEIGKESGEDLTPEEAAAEAARLAELGRKIETEAMKKSPDMPAEKAVETMLERAAIGAKLAESGKSIEDVMAASSCSQDLESCVAANVDLSDKLTGKSGTLPSCWKDPITQEIQYLYLARLANDGIRLENVEPTSEAARKVKPNLPPHGLEIGVRYSEVEFRSKGAPLFDWSEKQTPRCRLYVKILDETGNDKNLYVRYKERGIERVFFFYKVN